MSRTTDTATLGGGPRPSTGCSGCRALLGHAAPPVAIPVTLSSSYVKPAHLWGAGR
jgi:hypothetical protein